MERGKTQGRHREDAERDDTPGGTLIIDTSIAVLSPSVFVTVTVELGSGPEDELHFHAGGQGIWIARMLRVLGHEPLVCAPIGGEPGATLLGLTRSWRINLSPVATVSPTPAYVHDRRQGNRVEVAQSPLPQLFRHEVDELYNRILELALPVGTCVVTGPAGPGQLPVDLYRRLGADLAAAGVRVVGDLHGKALMAFLDGGPLEVLKVSAGDLREDGLFDDAASGHGSADLLADVMDDLGERGVGTVVVSRGGDSALARLPEGYREVRGPALEVVDAAGSGDSMTAALAASLVEGRDAEESLRRAWAAGAANVTRHGLGSGTVELIDELARQATVVSWGRT